MRLFLLPAFVVLAAACVDLKTAGPPAEPAPAPETDEDPTEPDPAPTAISLTPPPVVTASPPPADPSTPSSDAGAAVPASVDDICEPYCGWRDRCPGTGQSTHAYCVTHCHGEWAARVPHLVDRYVTYVKACFTQLTCERTDDYCFSNYAAVDPDPANIPEVKQCLAMVTTCADAGGEPAGGGPSKSTCYALSPFDQATRTAAAQCLALECSVMRKCLSNTWGGD